MADESELRDLAFVELLSDADIAAALDLRQNFTPRYQRCRRLDHFRECVTTLCSYVEQQRDDDWKRALVTGICPCGTVLGVNSTRLQAFTHRSKSSINDIFSKLKYQTIPINQRNSVHIFRKIPFLETHPEELRQWTFRAIAHCPEPAHTRDPGEQPHDPAVPAAVKGGVTGGEWDPFADAFSFDGFWM
jgi:hypothetical protein